MIHRISLAASVAAAALVATPAVARPMTATDMHMMRRLGSHSVSPDGRHAVFTLSTTDLAANKRNNVVHILDLKTKGATPQPLAALTQGAHDAVFGNDGAIWYLAPVGEQDQLFRMAVGGQPAQLSSFKGDISGFKVSADGSRVILWADRDLRCTDFSLCRPAECREDRIGPIYDQLFVRHWDTWASRESAAASSPSRSRAAR